MTIPLDFLQQLTEEATGSDEPSKEEVNHSATNQENAERPRKSGMGNDLEQNSMDNGTKIGSNGNRE